MFKRVMTSILILLITLVLTLGAVAAANLQIFTAYIEKDMRTENEPEQSEVYEIREVCSYTVDQGIQATLQEAKLSSTDVLSLLNILFFWEAATNKGIPTEHTISEVIVYEI